MTGFSFSRARVLQVSGIVILVIVGVSLPYLVMVWQNPASEIVVFRGSLFPSANFVGGLEPLDLLTIRQARRLDKSCLRSTS
jgi:hypothetical protein